MRYPQAPGTFMGGFMQGYGFVDDIKAREGQQQQQDRRMEMAEERLGMQKERLGMARESHEQQQEARGLQIEQTRTALDQSRKQAQDQERVRALNAALHAYKNNAEPPEWVRPTLDDMGIDVNHVVSPEYGRAMDTLQGAATGKIKPGSPEVITALNTVYAPKVKKAVGKPARDGGVIRDVRIAGLVPGQESGELYAGVEVIAEREDGSTYRYEAPMTANHSADAENDPYVKSISVRDLVKDARGRMLLHKALKAEIESGIMRHGGGVRTPEYGLQTLKQGDKEVTYQTKDGQLVGEPLAEANRWSPDKRGGAGGMKLTDQHRAEREIADLVKEQFSRYDSKLQQYVLDNSKAEQVRFGTSIASGLFTRYNQQAPGMSLAEYADIGSEAANLVVPLKDAEKLAKAEAEEKAGFWTSGSPDFEGSRDNWVKKRALEIYQESIQSAARRAQVRFLEIIESKSPGGYGMKPGPAPEPGKGATPKADKGTTPKAKASAAPKPEAKAYKPSAEEKKAASQDPDKLYSVLRKMYPNASLDRITSKVKKHFNDWRGPTHNPRDYFDQK